MLELFLLSLPLDIAALGMTIVLIILVVAEVRN